jgi:hypothetical protein
MARVALRAAADEPAFVRAAGEAIGRLGAADRHDGCLTLPLLVSAALRDCGLDRDLDQACRSLLALRDAVLASGALQAACEPVPLVVCERRQALLHLTSYLDDLVDRAARAGGCRRGDVAAAALAWLAA